MQNGLKYSSAFVGKAGVEGAAPITRRGDLINFVTSRWLSPQSLSFFIFSFPYSIFFWLIPPDSKDREELGIVMGRKTRAVFRQES